MAEQQSTYLRAVGPDDFLPPISRWSRLGGLALVGVLGGTIAIAALFKYNVVVKAPAVLRPEGELRIVEAATQGRVQQILVNPNDIVAQGDALVILDKTEVRSRQQQVQASLDQIQRQRSYLQQELLALEGQIQAKAQSGETAIVIAQAELDLRQQLSLEEQTTTAADVRAAEAAVKLAQEEFRRYQQLASMGALADLQLKEKTAALETAQAGLDKAKGRLNPSNAAASQAQDSIQQTMAEAQVSQASLGQVQANLRRQQAELLREQQAQQQTLAQLQMEIAQTTLRAPIAGTVQSINLRNADQVVEVGEAIATIVPTDRAIVIQAQVAQSDINRVANGQAVNIRLDSCPYTDYGTLHGTVTAISPDTQTSEQGMDNQPPAYAIDIVPQKADLEKHFAHSNGHSCALQSGMRGRADIITRRQTLLTSLVRALRLTINL